MRNYELYIGGEWVKPAAGEYFESYIPFKQEPWARIAQADETDVRTAVEVARQAFETTWRKTPGVERARLMLRLAALLEGQADDMGVLETSDNGKVIRETKSQMLFSVRLLRFYAGYADKIFGQVIPLDQANNLARLIPSAAKSIPVQSEQVIWNSPLAMILIAGLIITEWILRKVYGLV